MDPVVGIYMQHNLFGNNVGTVTLEKLCQQNIMFRIPSYQRGYRWNSRHVQALISDLKIYADKIKGVGAPDSYCLQPIVVQPVDGHENEYFIVDGQQRLTTLKLMLACASEQDIGWQIAPFEKSGEACDNASRAKVWSEESLSGKCKENAKRCIRKSIEDVKTILSIRQHIVFIYYKLKSWASEEDDELARKVFRRLNAGKIGLTNAELIRAFFMEEGAIDEPGQMEIAAEWEQMANRLKDDAFWHMFNIGKRPVHERMDRLFEIVADQIRDQNGARRTPFEMIEDSVRTMTKISEKYKCICAASKKDVLESWWQRVLELYWMLEKCYDDIPLYHYIGWLRRATDNKFKTIYGWYVNDPVGFRERVRLEIKQRLILRRRMVRYAFDSSRIASVKSVKTFPYFFGRRGCCPTFEPDQDKQCFRETPDEIRNLLLFFNLERLNQTHVLVNSDSGSISSNNRFPFDLYDDVASRIGWDVEHVSSYTENPMTKRTDQVRWAISVAHSDRSDDDLRYRVAQWLVNIVKDEKEWANVRSVVNQNKLISQGEFVADVKSWFDRDLAEFSEHVFEELYMDWASNHRGELLFEDDNVRMGNLVILDAKTNRGYKNAMYSTKRECVQKVETGRPKLENQRFVLPATSDVFKKAYSERPETFSFWTKDDLESYEKEMARVFIRFIRDNGK